MNTYNERAASDGLSRRRLLQRAAGAAALAATGWTAVGQAAERRPARGGRVVTKGRINQSVCAWCFKPMELETLEKLS